MPADTNFDLLTMAEVATLLHCSKAHVGNLVAGRVRSCAPIPAVRLGRRKLVRRETLNEWLRTNEGLRYDSDVFTVVGARKDQRAS